MPTRASLRPRVFPSPLPDSPVLVFRDWLDAAERTTDGDFNAMALASSTPDGRPSVRVVLCKQFEERPPAVVFYTNYASRKGRELQANPRAAGVFYWPHLGRQARVEGRVEPTTPEESDACFATRPMLSRLGAIASRQSSPLASRAQLAAQVLKAAVSMAADRRPAEWGGFRILLDRVELWQAGRGRLHDRVEWVLQPHSDPPRWSRASLSP